ncbi:MAG: 30S ribosomal protein S6 [Candidatus Blackburnbacteria bacterium]|nr:30S ribosomal protein S6 [Candidatus Blackburnbacteria bacterium]
MRNYELTVVLPGDTTEAKQKKVLEKVEKFVSNVSGEVLGSTSWGKRDLFYPIAKKTSGVYYFLTLALPPEGVSVVNREVELDPEVLRHLLVVADRKVEQVEQVEKEKKEEKPKKVAKRAKAIKKIK